MKNTAPAPRVDPARLDRCLNPRSIAVIGGVEASRVIQQCRKLGFDGALSAVNPKRGSIEGLRCYADIDALPSPPDVAFIAVPAEASIELVARLSRLGAGGAVCYASGFKEIGARNADEDGDARNADDNDDARGAGEDINAADDGDARQRRLIRAAGAMPVIGPNCYGFINLLSGAALWPDYHGASRAQRGAAIFSQSGNVSLNLSMQQRRLPLAWLVSVGNQAVVGVEDCIAAALARAREDDSITAIGLHIEGLNDLPRFARLAEQARAQGVPMVALKVGRSAIGARITRSHTATLAGDDAWYDALFERLGVGRADTPEAFIESLKLLTYGGALRGNRIDSMSCSGGEAALVADLAAARAIEFPPLE
ncbi:MAG: CoA-binding protein, partial [bacterium]